MNKTIPMMCIVAVAVGLLGFNTLTTNPQLGVSTQDTSKGGFMGHLTFVVKDKDGNIKAYRQSDNTITDNGKNCAPVVLFGATSPGSCLAAAQAQPYKVIGLITQSSFDEASALSNLGVLTLYGLAPTAAGSDTVQTTALTTTSGTATVVETATFTYASTATTSQTVQGAALIDTTTTPTASTTNMFAAKAFTGGAVTLSPGDSLTVTWNIGLTG